MKISYPKLNSGIFARDKTNTSSKDAFQKELHRNIGNFSNVLSINPTEDLASDSSIANNLKLDSVSRANMSMMDNITSLKIIICIVLFLLSIMACCLTLIYINKYKKKLTKCVSGYHEAIEYLPLPTHEPLNMIKKEEKNDRLGNAAGRRNRAPDYPSSPETDESYINLKINSRTSDNFNKSFLESIEEHESVDGEKNWYKLSQESSTSDFPRLIDLVEASAITIQEQFPCPQEFHSSRFKNRHLKTKK